MLATHFASQLFMNAATIVPPVLLVLGCFAYIFWPQTSVMRVKEKTRIDYLRERKDVIYENLRDLNFEFKAGKYPEEDFTRQRDELEGEAATVLAEIDALGG